jgi:hypothetical protein
MARLGERCTPSVMVRLRRLYSAMTRLWMGPD